MLKEPREIGRISGTDGRIEAGSSPRAAGVVGAVSGADLEDVRLGKRDSGTKCRRHAYQLEQMTSYARRGASA